MPPLNWNPTSATVMYHLMQYYIIYQQLMHTVNLIIWCYCIQCQCLVLATHNSIGLPMCSLQWVVARYWKISLAIQSIQICEIVLTFTIPWDRSGIGYFVNNKCFMMSWLVLSCQCLGDSHRICLETRTSIHAYIGACFVVIVWVRHDQ